METLKTYLEGRKKADFAKAIGTSPSYLSQLLAGTRSPSRKLMMKISAETGGNVDVVSWFPATATQGAAQ